MTASVADRLGIGPHELVSIVGAGGKTTIMLSLADDLASRGAKVVVTTTTKMAQRQIAEPVCWSPDPVTIDATLVAGTPLFVMSGTDDRKVKGLAPSSVDRLFSQTQADYVLVEADGARSMPIKAPAPHEPVIPTLSTTAIVVMSADALGNRIREVAHRPERVAELLGATENATLTPDRAARVLLSPNGGLKGVPEGARMVIALTKVSPSNEAMATRVASSLSADARVDGITLFPLERAGR